MEQHTTDSPSQGRQDDSWNDAALAPLDYAGFWIRLLAFILDSILATLVMLPILLIFYDLNDFLAPENLGATYYVIAYGFPFLAFVLFWKYRSATPGKIWMDIYIVDADTLGKPTTVRLVLRYLGYYLSSFLLLLGFVWIAFDSRKQGLHDKIANTVVLRNTAANAERVEKRMEKRIEKVRRKTDVDESQTANIKPATAQDPWKE